MIAAANLLALNPEVRAAHKDWLSLRKARIEAGYDRPGYEWAPAEGNARQLFIDATRDAAKEVQR